MLSFLDLDPEHVQRVAAQVERDGYAALDDLLPPAMLADLQEYVRRLSSVHDHHCYVHHGVEQMQGSAIASIARYPGFEQLMSQLYQHAAGRPALPGQVLPVLRCVEGQGARRMAHTFHFDAQVVTLLIPVVIPTEGSRLGDLVMFPNLRRVYHNVLINVLQKALLQNRPARALLAMAIARGWVKPLLVKIRPGSAYVFWGYRTLHANLPCDPAFKRATVLFHYGDPHRDNWITRGIFRISRYKANRVR